MKELTPDSLRLTQYDISYKGEAEKRVVKQLEVGQLISMNGFPILLPKGGAREKRQV